MTLIQQYGIYFNTDTGELHVNNRIERNFSVIEYDKNTNMVYYKTYENIKSTNKMEEDTSNLNMDIRMTEHLKRRGIFYQAGHVAKRDINMWEKEELNITEMTRYKPNKSKTLTKGDINKKMEHLIDYLDNDYDVINMNLEDGRILAELRRAMEKKWIDYRDYKNYVPPRIIITTSGEGVQKYVEKNCCNRRIVYVDDTSINYENCDSRTEVIAIKSFNNSKNKITKFYQELPLVNLYDIIIKPRVLILGVEGDFKSQLGELTYKYIKNKALIEDIRPQSERVESGLQQSGRKVTIDINKYHVEEPEELPESDMRVQRRETRENDEDDDDSEKTID